MKISISLSTEVLDERLAEQLNTPAYRRYLVDELRRILNVDGLAPAPVKMKMTITTESLPVVLEAERPRTLFDDETAEEEEEEAITT